MSHTDSSQSRSRSRLPSNGHGKPMHSISKAHRNWHSSLSSIHSSGSVTQSGSPTLCSTSSTITASSSIVTRPFVVPLNNDSGAEDNIVSFVQAQADPMASSSNIPLIITDNVISGPAATNTPLITVIQMSNNLWTTSTIFPASSTSASASAPEQHQSSLGLLLGSIMGSIATFLIFSLIFCIYQRRRSRLANDSDTTDTGLTPFPYSRLEPHSPVAAASHRAAKNLRLVLPDSRIEEDAMPSPPLPVMSSPTREIQKLELQRLFRIRDRGRSRNSPTSPNNTNSALEAEVLQLRAHIQMLIEVQQSERTSPPPSYGTH
ncbi:hypothetical protein C8J56DRAFT_937124 [Mycena floridula]|nr:hypothetical protein C8J56DRAFT_937124 [Mycena floridula]